MMLLRPPGVYRAETDTEVLIDTMRRGGFAAGRDVLDLGTGSGAVAIAASLAGASSVTAVDLSWRSVRATRLNARRHGARVAVEQGDLYAPVAGRRFDLIVSNPPYVPALTERLSRHRRSRCWDGGTDGRAVLDRICAGAADSLTPDGQVLLVHSALCGTQATVDALADAGFAPAVLARASIPFGPVMRSRVAMLEQRGLIEPGQQVEELVVIGAIR
ncbi:HemK2/MTQ2 family protein methyltransferase [Pseudonocardia saturnea]